MLGLPLPEFRYKKPGDWPSDPPRQKHTQDDPFIAEVPRRSPPRGRTDQDSIGQLVAIVGVALAVLMVLGLLVAAAVIYFF